MLGVADYPTKTDALERRTERLEEEYKQAQGFLLWEIVRACPCVLEDSSPKDSACFAEAFESWRFRATALDHFDGADQIGTRIVHITIPTCAANVC